MNPFSVLLNWLLLPFLIVLSWWWDDDDEEPEDWETAEPPPFKLDETPSKGTIKGEPLKEGD